MLESIISFLSCISYSLWICLQISSNSSNVVFNTNYRKSTENGCGQWDITETNNWIRLIIYNDNS